MTDLKALREKAVARDADGYVNMIVGTEVILAMIERIEKLERTIVKAAWLMSNEWDSDAFDLILPVANEIQPKSWDPELEIKEASDV